MRTALSFLLIIFLASCGSKKELSPQEIIAGTDSNIWTAKTEYDASGDKMSMTDEEKDESMRFYSNGTFSMQSNTEVANGTWEYQASGPTLSLIFDGESVSENFRITEMEENRMTLEAGDGSRMVLQKE